MTTRVRLTPYDKDTTKVNLTDYDDEVLGDDFLVTGTINKVVINIADRKSEEASYIPQGFKQPRSKRDIKNIILKPVSKEGGNYSCTDPVSRLFEVGFLSELTVSLRTSFLRWSLMMKVTLHQITTFRR